jgi:hypothetical protein
MTRVWSQRHRKKKLLIHTSILGLFDYGFSTSEYKIEQLVNEERELI